MQSRERDLHRSKFPTPNEHSKHSASRSVPRPARIPFSQLLNIDTPEHNTSLAELKPAFGAIADEVFTTMFGIILHEKKVYRSAFMTHFAIKRANPIVWEKMARDLKKKMTWIRFFAYSQKIAYLPTSPTLIASFTRPPTALRYESPKKFSKFCGAATKCLREL